jgi:hypothetical protein
VGLAVLVRIVGRLVAVKFVAVRFVAVELVVG